MIFSRAESSGSIGVDSWVYAKSNAFWILAMLKEPLARSLSGSCGSSIARYADFSPNCWNLLLSFFLKYPPPFLQDGDPLLMTSKAFQCAEYIEAEPDRSSLDVHMLIDLPDNDLNSGCTFDNAPKT